MKKIGTPLNFVNKNNFVSSVINKHPDGTSVIGEIPDLFRYFSGNFWSQKYNKLSPAEYFPLYAIHPTQTEGVYVLKADKSKFQKERIKNGLIDYSFDKDLWKQHTDYIINYLSNQIFYDYYTNYTKPVNIPEVQGEVGDNKNYINREFIYNFLAREYEVITNNIAFSTRVLPTIYTLLVDKNVDTRTEEENLILSLGGLIQKSLVDSLVTSKDPEAWRQYFREYAKVYQTQEAVIAINQILESEAILNIDKPLSAVTYNINKDNIPFPYFSYMEMSNLSSEKTDLIHIMNSLGSIDKELLEYLQKYAVIQDESIVFNDTSIYDDTVPTYSLKEWLSYELSDQQISQQVKYTNLLGILKKNIGKNKRKYEHFMQKACETDTLFYKIEKKLFNYDSKTIQTFYITPTESDLIKFFDTQIKYGTEYYYVISTITLVYGNEYSYSPYYESEDLEMLEDISNGEYKLKIKNNISYSIMEIPYARTNGSVYEAPYTKPEIKFVLSDNNIGIELMRPALTSYEEFNAVEDGEVKLFESIRKSQDNARPMEIVSHSNKDPLVTLQVYKLLDRPSGYLSFQGKLNKALTISSNLTMIKDSIMTNKKYYYLFRYLNNHEIPSNTSIVYEVTLKDEDGYRYLETNVIDLLPEIDKNKQKMFKRYLLIRPSSLQIIPSADVTADSIYDVEFGPKDEKVWNRNFVLQIRSLKSNRIIKYYLTPKLNRKI
jgi:hypothetical protein